MPVFAPAKLWTPRGIVRQRPAVLRPRRTSRRLSEMARWRRSLGAFNAGKLQRDPATGKIFRNADGKILLGTDTDSTCCCGGTALPELIPCYPGGATGLGLRPEDNTDAVVFGQVVQYRGGCYSVGADAPGLTPTDADATYLADGCGAGVCLPCVACPPIDDVTVSAGQYAIAISVSLCTDCWDQGSGKSMQMSTSSFSGTFCLDFISSLGVYLEGFCVWSATHTIASVGTFYDGPGCTGDPYPVDTITFELLRETFFDGSFAWTLDASFYASTAPSYDEIFTQIFDGGVTGVTDCRTGFTMTNTQTGGGCSQVFGSGDTLGHGGSASGVYGC